MVGGNGTVNAQWGWYVISVHCNDAAEVVILFLLKAILNKSNTPLEEMESKFVLTMQHNSKYCIFIYVKGNLLESKVMTYFYCRKYP